MSVEAALPLPVDPMTGYISGITFPPRPVTFFASRGQAIFEGDIVLGTVEDFERQTAYLDQQDEGLVVGQAVVLAGQRYRWPKGIVPFEVHPELPEPARVQEAILHWQQRTPLRFVERTPTNAGQFSDWVTFTPGVGCSSSVGMQGGQQFVELEAEPVCAVGNVIHEIGHLVGLWHEQSREDRDGFVIIRWENIISGCEPNFDQQVVDGDDVGQYDYGSIMHYPRDAFSANGGSTIEPLDPAADIGQRQALSANDVAAVHAMYAFSPPG